MWRKGIRDERTQYFLYKKSQHFRHLKLVASSGACWFESNHLHDIIYRLKLV